MILLVLLLMGAPVLALEADKNLDFSLKANDVALIIGGDSTQDLFFPTLSLAYKTLSENGLPPDHIAVVTPQAFDFNGDGQNDEVFEPLSLNEAFRFVKNRQQSLVLTIQNRPSTLSRMKLHFMGMDVSLTPDQSKCRAVLKNFPQLVRPQTRSDTDSDKS